VTGVHRFALRMACHPAVKGRVFTGLADVEHRLAMGGSESVQMGSLVGVFQLARAEIVRLGTPQATA
jgi:hypothetical protein